jgi:lipopolysaccharide transport system permease protein
MVPSPKKELMAVIVSGERNPSFWRYLRDFLDIKSLALCLARRHELIAMMTWRDFSSRYRGSLGGLTWSVIQPLVMMVIYTIVFSLFLKIRFSTDASPFTFSVYLLCGLLPWTAFSEGMSRSKEIIRGNINLVKRVVFPLEILPINLALAATIQQVIGLILLVPLAWVVSGNLYWTILLVPAILLMQLLFAAGMNWITASLAVYLPDIGQMINLILAVWMFLTPIFYPEDVVPTRALILFEINPMARLVHLYRGVFMTGQLPSLGYLLGTFFSCLLIFLIGHFWFKHTKSGFADVL